MRQMWNKSFKYKAEVCKHWGKAWGVKESAWRKKTSCPADEEKYKSNIFYNSIEEQKELDAQGDE